MKRIALCLFTLLCSAALVNAAPLPPEQRQASVAYAHGLQNQDGGYRVSSAVGVSQLGATSSALRILKYFGGEPKETRSLRLFVLSCFDPATGGFSDLPNGNPDVRSTAMGLMTLAELKMARNERTAKAAEYLQKSAKSLPDIYISAAALDSAGIKPADPSAWIAAWEATRSADGTYGKGAADTASAVITTLRLGGAVKDRDAAARVLRAAQRPDGGFPGAEGASDLGGTYRIMRALYMLKEKPDLARLHEFIGRCRNGDNGYGPQPGQPSTVSTTYFASIVLKWIDEMEKQ
jgi:hypothetical protein